MISCRMLNGACRLLYSGEHRRFCSVRDVGQAVLGATRGVLGATRTGDDSHALAAGFVTLGSLGGIITWLIVWFIKRRKRNAAA